MTGAQAGKAVAADGLQGVCACGCWLLVCVRVAWLLLWCLYVSSVEQQPMTPGAVVSMDVEAMQYAVSIGVKVKVKPRWVEPGLTPA